MVRRLVTFSRLGCFSFTVQPVAPRQLFISNVADSDVLLGSVSSFLPYRPANGPTTRPFGTTLQAVNSSGLHSVTRVPFFSSDLVSGRLKGRWWYGSG